jgi:gamma-glutamylputrescine oxidase
VSETVYWQEPHAVSWPSPPLPEETDVVVVGGGLAGLAAAYELAARGARVVLLERSRLADGASGRNGGQVLTGFGPDYREVANRWGSDTASALWAEGCRAVDDVAALVRDGGIACDFHRGGHLAVAVNPNTLVRLEREAEALSAEGFPVQMLDASAVAARLGWAGYVGALFDPGSGTVNPYRLALGLAQRAARQGATVVEQAAAAIAVERPGRFTVQTPHGSVRATHVILAVNAGLPDVLPELVARIHPVVGHVMATSPLPPELLSSILPDRPAVFEESGRYVYFQRSADGRIVFGGRVDRQVSLSAAQQLYALMTEVAPPLRALKPAYVWQGPLAIAPDGLPRLARTSAGIVWVGGFSGHGVALAVRLGRQAARWVMGEEPTWPLQSPPPRAVPWHPRPVRFQFPRSPARAMVHRRPSPGPSAP